MLALDSHSPRRSRAATCKPRCSEFANACTCVPFVRTCVCESIRYRCKGKWRLQLRIATAGHEYIPSAHVIQCARCSFRKCTVVLSRSDHFDWVMFAGCFVHFDNLRVSVSSTRMRAISIPPLYSIYIQFENLRISSAPRSQSRRNPQVPTQAMSDQ